MSAPPGYYLPTAPLPAPYAPLQLPAPPTALPPPHQASGISSSAQPGVYAMPTISSLGRPDVITGILPVDSHDALILFDSGATYSFVSLDFVKKSSLYSQEISQSVRVSSPVGLITSSVACPGCVILIGDEDFVANLMVIPLPSFNVILGMDWLHRY
jgi:hypothetical protein